MNNYDWNKYVDHLSLESGSSDCLDKLHDLILNFILWQNDGHKWKIIVSLLIVIHIQSQIWLTFSLLYKRYTLNDFFIFQFLTVFNLLYLKNLCAGKLPYFLCAYIFHSSIYQVFQEIFFVIKIAFYFAFSY